MIAGRIRRGELVEELGFERDGKRRTAAWGPAKLGLPLSSLEHADETSFFSWDGATLFLARDRWGARPIHWRREPYGMAFATSLRFFRDFVPQLPPGHVLSWDSERIQVMRYPTPPPVGLRGSLESAVRVEGPFGVALSGGVDSAVLLALSRGVPYVLAPPWPEYSEVEEARETARSLGLEPRIVEAGESDYVRAFEDAVIAAEAPIWNLHAVSKLLLARAAAKDGIRTMLLGEGADERLGDGKFDETAAVEVFQMARAMCEAAGVAARFPYLDHRVGVRERAGKRELRELARSLGLAAAGRPKKPRLAPEHPFVAQYLPPGSPPDMREASRVILRERLCAGSRGS